MRKLTQLLEEQGDNTVCGDEPGGGYKGLWMEVFQEDLKMVKKALASYALLQKIIGEGWLRGYARLLLHQAMETRAAATNRRCPAPGYDYT